MNHRFKPRPRIHRLAAVATAMACVTASGARASADLAVGDAKTPAGRQAEMSFVVTRSGDTGSAVSVDYATADGSAHAGEDYVATSGSLAFAAGETRKTVTVPVLRRLSLRPKTFTLGLSNASAPPTSALSFHAAGAFPAPSHLDTAVSADFNGDGKPDVLGIGGDDSTQQTLTVLRNDTVAKAATASFATGFSYGGIYDGRRPGAADLNRDGRPDVVLPTGNGTMVFVNTTPAGSPTVTFAPPLMLDDVSGDAVAFGDFDRDGVVDVALVHCCPAQIRIYRNTSPVGAANPILTPIAELPTSGREGIVAADFDGDGKIDLAVGDFDGSDVSVHLNTTPAGRSITFAPESRFPVAQSPTSIAAADLNGDGKADIATANGGVSLLGTTFTVLMSTTAIGSATAAFVPTNIQSGAPFGVSLGDMDGDGLADIVIAQQSDPADPAASGSVSVYLNRTPNGARRPRLEKPVSAVSAYIPHYSVLADFNADGVLDVESSDFYFDSLMNFNFQSSPSDAVRIVDASGIGTITHTTRNSVGISTSAP